jgi:hypothetical protein
VRLVHDGDRPQLRGPPGAVCDDGPVPSAPTAPRARPLGRLTRALGLLLAVVSVVALLGGCARVRAALAVQPDDTVVGEIVVATPEQSPEDPGPPITPPPDLADALDISEYRQDGYAGSVVRFRGLTFAQVSEVIAAAGPPGEKVTFTLRRAGGRVVVSGAVDLTTVSVDRADFQLKISFPGEVVESNGTADGGTVSWVFTPGEVGDINALVAFDDPNAPSAINWTLLLGVLVAGAGTAVVVLARRTRNPPLSQTRR